MKSSPIYNIISNPGRKSDCSFGAREGFEQDIRVGTSARNSHTLGTVSVHRAEGPEGTVDFFLSINGKEIAHGVLQGKNFQLYEVHDLRG